MQISCTKITVIAAITFVAIMASIFGDQHLQLQKMKSKYELQSQMLQWAISINEKGRRNPNMKLQELLDAQPPFKFSQEVICRAMSPAEFKDAFGRDADFIIETPGFVVYGNGRVRSTNLKDWKK